MFPLALLACGPWIDLYNHIKDPNRAMIRAEFSLVNTE
jgi:hypothetical protein